MRLTFNNHWTEQHHYYIVPLDALSKIAVCTEVTLHCSVVFSSSDGIYSIYFKHLLYNSADSFQIDCEQLAGNSNKICSIVKITPDYVFVFTFFFFTVAVMIDLYFYFLWCRLVSLLLCLLHCFI